VVSKTNGLIFEKTLIVKALKVEEKCPVTNAPLREDDLINIQGMNGYSKKLDCSLTSFSNIASKVTPPHTVGTAGVPGLLSALQVHWICVYRVSFC
jgi:hypothetical protein